MATVSPLVALVADANCGIGLEVVRQLGAMGFVVLVGTRAASRATRAASTPAGYNPPVLLAVTNAASVAAMADDLRARPGCLDVLVNNV